VGADVGLGVGSDVGRKVGAEVGLRVVVGLRLLEQSNVQDSSLSTAKLSPLMTSQCLFV